jgi:sulfate/thiosulfate-binding protein
MKKQKGVIMKRTRTYRKGKYIIGAALLVTLTVGMTACGSTPGADVSSQGEQGSGQLKITNVSYDPTRELYQAYNEAFVAHYQEETGETPEIIQSHGGSGGQARSVVEGAEADVVTLALEHDITLIEQAGLIEPGWISEFDRDSSPYTSTIVFLVRKGNPKNITDWDSLTKEGVEIINPDPKSSGGACWNFLAAWHYADLQYGGDEEKIKAFETKLYDNVTVMDSGARGATTTFVENGQGDVLIAWENEAISTVEEYPDEYEIISPSISILAQPSVAIVDENADKNGTQELAHEYLEYLYSDEAQLIIGEHGYRPSNEEILNQFSDKFDLNMELCTIQDFGGWDAAYEKFFNDGAIFDEIYNQ